MEYERVAGVKITPSVVEFYDAEPNVVHQMKISVQNLDKVSKNVKLLPPNSKNFCIECKEDEKFLAPGLELSAIVEYYNEETIDCEDNLVFKIDEHFVEVPLLSYAPKSILTINGSCDLGTIVADGKVYTRDVAILNHGIKFGDFKIEIDEEAELPFKVMPLEGSIQPGYSQPIRFEFVSKNVGEIDVKLRVLLDNEVTDYLHFKANVVSRKLQIQLKEKEGRPVDRVDFGCTYYGSDVVKGYTLYNESPVPISFVGVFEEDAEGEEKAVDVTQTVMNLCASKERLDSPTPEALVVEMVPNEGTLKPFEECQVFFKFSPKFSKSKTGWKKDEKLAPRRDYAMFLHIKAVGIVNKANEDLDIELALVGTALPVAISILPSLFLEFDDCPIGQQKKSIMHIRNDSADVPICFAVRKIAHFHCSPPYGFVTADDMLDIIFSFQPRQSGTFNNQMILDIIGQTCDIRTSGKPVYRKIVLESRTLIVSGFSSVNHLSTSAKLKPQVEPSFVHDETSLQVFTSQQTAFDSDFRLQPSKTDFLSNENIRVAHPDDRACSIRPYNSNDMVRTRFTKLERYTYHDPDYSHTPDARDSQKKHKEKYNSYINTKAQELRLKKSAKDFDKYENNVELGMRPAQGLRKPKLKLSDIGKEMKQIKREREEKMARKSNLLSSKAIDDNRSKSSKKKIVDGLKAVPSTPAEKKDCSKVLSPQELFQINFENELIDFGDICRKSITSKTLKIANNLPQNILVNFDVDCKELRQTSPLSQVIPPNSVAKLEFIFESPREGKFERSINYTINTQHQNHILIHANVVGIALELTETELFLHPIHGAPVETGFRKTVDLINTRNMVAEFVWTPVLSPEGTSFTIRPAKGVVEPYSRLTLEVTFYPSYSASCVGRFVATVEGGKDLTLDCRAQMGYASCSFIERRLMFGALPLQLITSRSAYLKNTSNNHAFFKVMNASPIDGMVINPKQGVVPVGGITEIQVLYRPESVQKFDTTIQVDIYGWKTISLRMGGQAEYPIVDINLRSFSFGGIYTGAVAKVPFKIDNVGRSNVLVVFNLSLFRDFKVFFPDHYEYSENNGIFHVNLSGHQTVHAELQFLPTEVAAYDFFLPVSINHLSPPSPAPSPHPPSIALSKPETYNQYDVPTARRRVRATALRAPLQLSNEKVEFKLPATYFDLKIEDFAGRLKVVNFVNNSREPITFSFDVNHPGCRELFMQNIFTFLFQRNSTTCCNDFQQNFESVTIESGQTYEMRILFKPVESTHYECKVPIILNGNTNEPYKFLQLSGLLMSPKLQCFPKEIQFQPVPLATKASQDVTLFYSHFLETSQITVNIPNIELEDGSLLNEILSIDFKHNNRSVKKCLSAQKNEVNKLSCCLTFKSTRPVCFNNFIEFICGETSCKLGVSASADNCILTTYNFLANSSNDFHIVCEKFKDKVNSLDEKSTETVFVPNVSPIRAPTGVSLTNSTAFSLRSSSYEDTGLDSSSPEFSEEGSIDQNLDSETFLLPYQFSEEIPISDTEEGKILREVLKCVQRWYSSQGWSHGPCPISVPGSLRSCLTAEHCNSSSNRSGSWNRDNSTRRGGNCNGNRKNIVELISHMCGKQVPGIPSNTSLPVDKKERIKSILWIYSTLITFIKCQGGMVANMTAHHLLDAADYHFYCDIMMTKESSSDKISEDCVTDCHGGFEMKSRKAWTNLLLQIIKVFVLAKLTPSNYKNLTLPENYPPLPTFNPNPFCSNVYSISERILLAWLNHHYEQQRLKCWRQNDSGIKPPSRWIVNFENDFVDGLVLASLICAYAPYVVSTELKDLYTQPNSAEQCLHNALKVVNALRKLGIDYDIIATDITEPNPVNIVLLCVHLYQRLPHYLPSKTVQFTGSLFSTVTKQIKLQNPSNKTIVYQAILVGKHAQDFNVLQGNTIQVPAKGQVEISVDFKSRFLRECECTLVLVGKRVGSGVGSTMTFMLKGIVNSINPLKTLKFASPCYELKKITFPIKNPFSLGGSFRMVLVETDPNLHNMEPIVSNISKKKSNNTSSRTDHGQKKKGKKRKSEKSVSELFQKLAIENRAPLLSVFWSADKYIDLGPYATTDVEIQFLPFDLGTRQCSLLFLNEEIGEFLYSIHAESLLPLPTEVPFFHDNEEKQNGSRVTSAMASHHSQGLLREDNSIIYMHCQADTETLDELELPVHNYARGKALLLATEQRMSEKEMRRRERTGIISAETILSALSCLQINDKADYKHPSELLGIFGTIQEHSVEVSSPFFSCPDLITIPVDTTSSCMEETVKLPITIKACDAGQYNCSIVLRAANDIRVYRIECTIKNPHSEVEMEFTSPAHQSVVQNVPVVNHSDLDWHLTSVIEGEGFTGPPSITAYARATTPYPLCFQPVYEGKVEGRLLLKNKSNGAERSFYLQGLATKPLPLDEIQIDCIVNEPTMKVLEVANKMPYKMVFQTFSDLDSITGPPFITVLPQQTASVPFNILTQRRGVQDGVVCFVYDANFVREMGLDRVYDIDSDDDEEGGKNTTKESHLSQDSNNAPPLISTECSSLQHINQSTQFRRPYKIWYSLRINSIPTEPIKCLEVQAYVFSSASIELLLKNPQNEELHLDVIIDGFHLYGEASVAVKPFSSTVYQLQYNPIVTGKSKASVIFQSDSCTEFWYDMVLIAENPLPKQLPIMQCPLGKSCYQGIPLVNPSVDDVTYDITCSNPNNFQLEGVDNMKVTIQSMGEVEVILSFVPSSLENNDHKAEILFFNDQQGSCFTFHAMGVVDKPNIADKYNLECELGGNASIIIPFHNPFFFDVLVDVDLQEKNSQDEVFGLLLNNWKNLLLPAKQTLDIPISYAPDQMRKQEASCKVYTRPFNADQSESSLYDNGLICWTYEIEGIPTCIPIKTSNAPVVQCRTRQRIEEQIEVTFAGTETADNSSYKALLKSLSPIHLVSQQNTRSDFADQFEDLEETLDYFIESGDADVDEDISRSVTVCLKRQSRHKITNAISLLFEVILSSSKTFNHLVHLIITSSSGAVWKYPIRFTSTEPISDDVITIKSTGLNKESKVVFRLSSQKSDSTHFNAYFASGYDDMFSVTPSTGELRAPKDNGTLFTIAYKPTFYGKTHRAKLLIQTREYQWIYDIKGETPEYTPPRAMAAIESHLSNARFHRTNRKNYVRENLQIGSTAVSSPLKGAPLFAKLSP